jgi:hypothetical protein
MCDPIYARFAMILAFVVTTAEASPTVWAIVAEKSDHQGRVEVNERTIERKGSKVKAWLRITEPNPFPVDSTTSRSTRFTSELIEIDCSKNLAQTQNKLYLDSLDSKVPIAQHGAYEAFEPVRGSPIASVVRHLCLMR